ncbi:MAG: hypothetical protein ACR2QQ_15315 [Gammaproteobacteria bacterium]
MAGQLEQEDPKALDQPTLSDLEREASTLCARVERLTSDPRLCTDTASRESLLQLQAATERRNQALQVLESLSREPEETRLCRLEQLIKALECSLDYFRPGEAELAL